MSVQHIIAILDYAFADYFKVAIIHSVVFLIDPWPQDPRLVQENKHLAASSRGRNRCSTVSYFIGIRLRLMANYSEMPVGLLCPAR